jgi:lytic murein transglycosylase
MRLIPARAGIAAGLMLAAVAAGHAQGGRCHGGASFEQWLDAFKREALAQGIGRATLEHALADATFDQSIVNKDRGQKVFQQGFLQFAGRMADGHRLQAGASRIKSNAALFARIEQQFGVPAPVIVAFWGLETDFGANNGDLPVLRSLVTLAYDCRRPQMFREELLNALRVIERGDLAPTEMVGAWAGEVGQAQFSPTAYLKYAVDFDGDGRRDLIHSVSDVLASSANLLAQNGWRRGEPWLQEVRVPSSLAWEQADLAVKHPRSQWAQWGVTLADGRTLAADDLQASLLLPMGRLGPAFLAYQNFHAFLEWNQSLVYATTAAYLATRIAGAPRVSPGNGKPSTLTAGQIAELQRQLLRQGHDVGKVDGKLGLATRAGVKQAQLKLGLPADSYPTPELLSRLGSGVAAATPRAERAGGAPSQPRTPAPRNSTRPSAAPPQSLQRP